MIMTGTFLCAGTTSSLSISPQNLMVFEGETATIICHGVYLDNLKSLDLSDEGFAAITRPYRRAKPRDQSTLVNVTILLPNLLRQEDGLKLRCVQLEFHSDISMIRVFGEWWVWLVMLTPNKHRHIS